MPSRRERDFVSFFNGFWYRDFPIIETFEDVGRRAVWTTHIASVVKRCADLMGAFTCYETGNRTDAVIQFIDKDEPTSRITWAKAEWEWRRANMPDVNEIRQLAEACNNHECEVAIFVGFCTPEKLEETNRVIIAQWRDVERPLLAFMIDFEVRNGRRRFLNLHSLRYSMSNNGEVSVRSLRPPQAALPWEVNGSRWRGARISAGNEIG